MPRLLFTKTDEAVWMSHLDLMRLMQRAFKRAGLNLKHTQGYNPRPSVSIAMPLSVGVESICELLDFDLEGDSVPCDQITECLNAALVPGVQVLKTYNDCCKIKDLAFLSCQINLEYDAGVPGDAIDSIGALFRKDSVIVEKKGKNGPTQQDIIPMIRRFGLSQIDEKTLQLSAVVCCQNPSLNPMQMIAAINVYLPQYAPDFARCRRLEVYDTNEKEFR